MRLDLHIHSTASDGSLTPGRVVNAAVAGKLDVIAIADHDTAVGVIEALASAPPSLRVIPAIELSSTHGPRDLHILGYGIDPLHDSLRSYSKDARTRRADRIQGMIVRLSKLGVTIDYADVVQAAGGEDHNLGRPHLAQVLVKCGHAQSVSDAFDRFLYDGGPVALPVELITPREGIELIHELGGIAVWAHPPLELLEQELPHFKSWGLDGVEVFRPRCTPDDRDVLLKGASRFDLMVTGGSDWHGPWHGNLGEFAIGPELVQRFLWRFPA